MYEQAVGAGDGVGGEGVDVVLAQVGNRVLNAITVTSSSGVPVSSPGRSTAVSQVESVFDDRGDEDALARLHPVRTLPKPRGPRPGSPRHHT
ncbi:hypothetical protein ADK57_36535 [Streptomyces sp. MMG1533]|nr:hypothetical protein ADK57_36535 [Streptomyces sp. MMG1533]